MFNAFSLSTWSGIISLLFLSPLIRTVNISLNALQGCKRSYPNANKVTYGTCSDCTFLSSGILTRFVGVSPIDPNID